MDAILVPWDISNILVDPTAHALERIHEACRWLRTNRPIGIAEPDGYDPFWIFSRYKDIQTIAEQNKIFHNGDRNITLTNREEQERIRELTDGRGSIARNIINMDPPDHPKYRKIAQNYFSPQSVAKLEESIRLIAREFVGRMAALGGTCDFARDISFVYPLRVIMNILGVPEKDEGLLLRLSQELFGVADPGQARGGAPRSGAEAAEALLAVNADFDAYLGELLEKRRRNPRDDFATIIAAAEIDGAPMPRMEAIDYLKVVATAGHDTTSSATAGGIWGLCDHPDQFARAKADLRLIPGLVAESIRYTSPSKITMRSATEDVTLAGQTIRQNDSVGLAWVSANRDEEVFEDPFAFRIDRPAPKPLGFGWGPHSCIGQHLARLEMRLLFEELLPRLAHIELAGQPLSLASLMVSGPKTVPISYRMV